MSSVEELVAYRGLGWMGTDLGWIAAVHYFAAREAAPGPSRRYQEIVARRLSVDQPNRLAKMVGIPTCRAAALHGPPTLPACSWASGPRQGTRRERTPPKRGLAI
jgi:hypothetical protein